MMYVVKTTDDELNYRVGPGKHYRKLGSLPSGAIVQGEVANGWLRTTLQGQTCYMSMDYLCALESCTLCYTDDEIVDIIHWLEGLL